MRYLSNDDISSLLPMPDVIAALRSAYEGMAQNANTYVPLIWLYAPTSAGADEYYRCSAVVGNSSDHMVAAVRIKSDVIGWPGDGTETKHCVRPGQFCGLILLFSTETGQPLAILQDGYLQHLRVGAASALGADVMAAPGARTLGVLGSGGMARSHVDAMRVVRNIHHVTVYSRSPHRRQQFVDELVRVGVNASAVSTPEEAVRDRDIVVSATDSIEPTFDPAWVRPGTHVTCIQKRELHPAMYERADTVAKLGERAFPPDVTVPRMQRVRGGLSAFIAGSPEEQRRIPRGGEGGSDELPLLTDLIASGWTRSTADEITLFLTGGTQGVQFAAVGGHVLRAAERLNAGAHLPAEWFVQDIRN